jgi:phosphopantothenoylcysteine decarboxylase/phosphopantothenate--cysteine ligase
MKTLKDKKILLGITGSIAAYKSAELIRLLKENGAEVRVIMTESSKNFITPLALSSLAQYPVYDTLMDIKNPMIHIELARWADLVLIAPASANFIAKLANGFADDLLSTVCIATQSPIMVAPAMNQQMWENITTQKNSQQLILNNNFIIGPTSGIQACGENGLGRMVEPEEIILQVIFFLQTRNLLLGKKVLITAGPTQEAIDPVRFISNHSSGKMGYALAEAAADAGANVTLISGPVTLTCSKRIQCNYVTTAQQMLEAVLLHSNDCEIFIATAAVADYRPESSQPQKIKKTTATMQLTLLRNSDILSAISQLESRPYLVGFAAETEDWLNNAKKKLQEKKLDMIVANEVNKSDRGFNSDYNELMVITNSDQQLLSYARKSELAKQLVEIIGNDLVKKRQLTRGDVKTPQSLGA